MVAGNAPSSKESDDPLQCLFQSQDMLVTQQKDTNYKGKGLLYIYIYFWLELII